MGSKTTDVGSNASGLVGANIGLNTPNRGNKGISDTSREMPAAGLADSGSTVDRLSRIDTSIGWLVVKRSMLSWFG